MTINSSRKTRIVIAICTNNRFESCNSLVKQLVHQISIFSLHNRIIILVLDNGSKAFLSNKYRLLNNLTNNVICLNLKYGGLSYSRNVALSFVRPNEYLYFLDDDIDLANKNFLRELVRIVDTHRPDFFGGPVDFNLPTPLKPWIREDWFIRNFARSGFGAKRLSGGNFGFKGSVPFEGLRFNEGLGMNRRRVRLGEEKDFLELFLATSINPKIFYSRKLRVIEEFDRAKLRFSYRIRREFAIGYANHSNHSHKVNKKFPRRWKNVRPKDIKKSLIFSFSNFSYAYDSLKVPSVRYQHIALMLTLSRLFGLLLRKLKWHA